MSVIFPTSPAKVKIHLLPKKAEFISYRISDVLTISAWMPDRFETISQEIAQSNDDFFYRHCENCDRNHCSFLEYYEDEDGNVDWDHSDLQDHCNVYDEGYHGQHCPDGYSEELKEISFDVSSMVFQISLSHLGNLPRFQLKGDSAYLQKFELMEDTENNKQFKVSFMLMASNVFGSEDRPEGICWGYNDRPYNLRQIVSQYFDTPFNNDLVNIGAFEDNCHEIRNCHSLSETYLKRGETYLNGQTDALLLIDAEADIQAFYTMLMAGFKPVPDAPHIMMIPLHEYEFELNNNLYRGYKTIEDSVGKSWFISPESEYEGLLVGQL